MPITPRRLFVWFFLIGTCGWSGCDANTPPKSSPKRPGTATPTTIRVAAASDLKYALEELIREFEKQHGATHVEATFGSSGSLFAEVSHDAPFDIFLSADMDYARKLAEQGQADKQTLFQYALGHLVVWVPKDSPLEIEKLGVQALLDSRVDKIAIANPETAPYGRAAVAALKKLGVHERIQNRLVQGENVSQAAQFVESGAAQAGVLALSLALAPALRDKGRFWRVPSSAHPDLKQGGVILNRCQERGAALAFCKFMQGTLGRATLQRFGLDQSRD